MRKVLLKRRTERAASRRPDEEPPRTLKDFLKAAWPLVVPNAPFIDGWHIDAICDHLEAQSRGELPRLVINVPPGSTKSTSVGVMWPAWEWTFNPGAQWMFGSYALELSRRDGMRMRDLIQSDWYRGHWDNFGPGNVWGQGRFDNDQGGMRMATSVGAAATGYHAHRQVVDDPLKATDAHSLTALEAAKSWWFQTMASRLLPNATRTIIMQRLHDLDLAGIAIEQGYELLKLPMEYEPKHHCSTSIGWEDPRTEPAELLCEARWDQPEVDRRKKEFGPDAWAAQDQQDPVPAGGAVYRPEWLQQWWRVLPDLTTARVIMSWDCAFKDHDTSSFVVGQCWARIGADFYLLDQVRAHMNFVETCSAIEAMRRSWPQATTVLVEDKANGTAVVDVLKSRIPGLVLVEPEGGKIARAYATQPLFAAGNVWLPHSTIADWIGDWVLEHRRFPKGVNDDQVDAQTQALRYLTVNDITSWIDAMRHGGAPDYGAGNTAAGQRAVDTAGSVPPRCMGERAHGHGRCGPGRRRQPAAGRWQRAVAGPARQPVPWRLHRRQDVHPRATGRPAQVG